MLAQKEKYILKYMPAIQNKWSYENWDNRKLRMVASAFLDTILEAGGRSVPLAIDIVLGYILTKNKPASLLGVDFSKDQNIRSLMFESMRYHPPVTVMPIWTTADGGYTWQHELICLDRALADPMVFPDPDVFILNRPYAEWHSVAWADFAIVNGDNANGDSHACPAKELSISMVIAFVKEYFVTGPWIVQDDDITFTYYGSSGFTVTKEFASDTSGAR